MKLLKFIISILILSTSGGYAATDLQFLAMSNHGGMMYGPYYLAPDTTNSTWWVKLTSWNEAPEAKYDDYGRVSWTIGSNKDHRMCITVPDSMRNSDPEKNEAWDWMRLKLCVDDDPGQVWVVDGDNLKNPYYGYIIGDLRYYLTVKKQGDSRTYTSKIFSTRLFSSPSPVVDASTTLKIFTAPLLNSSGDSVVVDAFAKIISPGVSQEAQNYAYDTISKKITVSTSQYSTVKCLFSGFTSAQSKSTYAYVSLVDCSDPRASTWHFSASSPSLFGSTVFVTPNGTTFFSDPRTGRKMFGVYGPMTVTDGYGNYLQYEQKLAGYATLWMATPRYAEINKKYKTDFYFGEGFLPNNSGCVAHD